MKWRSTRRQTKDLGGSDGPADAPGVFDAVGASSNARRSRGRGVKVNAEDRTAAEQHERPEQHEPPQSACMGEQGLVEEMLADAARVRCAGNFSRSADFGACTDAAEWLAAI